MKEPKVTICSGCELLCKDYNAPEYDEWLKTRGGRGAIVPYRRYDVCCKLKCATEVKYVQPIGPHWNLDDGRKAIVISTECKNPDITLPRMPYSEFVSYMRVGGGMVYFKEPELFDPKFIPKPATLKNKIDFVFAARLS